MSAAAQMQIERKIADVNRTEMARELALGKSHVSLILSGKRMPSLPVAAKVAEKLGVSLDELYGHLVRVN